mmetsp:Transcript_55102/g.155031  ORF Transcript_55102/g.155031 Transcript_55102/m.155031 type:complete len:251 (-) Transcript_55102:179-931(-)
MASVGSLGRLLAAATELSDAELAVALQGVVSKRPAVREMLFNVWSAEEDAADADGGEADAGATGQPGPASARRTTGAGGGSSSRRRGGTRAKRQGGGARPAAGQAAPNETGGDAAAAAKEPEEEGDATAEARIWDLSRRFAASGGASKVGTEHVLASVVEVFPGAAREALGQKLYEHLVDLLDKSQLQVPPQNGPSGADIVFEQDAQELIARLPLGEPVEAFHMLKDLDDAAAATQLMTMASIFADRADD